MNKTTKQKIAAGIFVGSVVAGSFGLVAGSFGLGEMIGKNSANKEIEKLKASYAHDKDNWVGIDEQFNILQEEYRELERTYKSMVDLYEGLRGAYMELSERLEKTEKEKEELQVMVKKHAENSAETQALLAQKEAECEQLKENLNVLEVRMMALMSEIDSLQKENEDLKNGLSNIFEEREME